MTLTDESHRQESAQSPDNTQNDSLDALPEHATSVKSSNKNPLQSNEFSNLMLRIYWRLLTRATQAEVARDLGKSKSTINYWANKLIKLDYLERPPNRAYPVTFEKGSKSKVLDKIILAKFGKSLMGYASSNETDTHDGRVMYEELNGEVRAAIEQQVRIMEGGHGTMPLECRVHAIQRKHAIIKRGDDINLQDVNKWAANATNFIEGWLVDEGAGNKWKIRLISDKTLVIYIPERTVYSADELKGLYYEDIPKEDECVSNWLQKRYGLELGPGKWYCKPHFAFPDKSGLMNVSRKFIIECYKSWTDASTGIPEYESDELSFALAYFCLPDILLETKKAGWCQRSKDPEKEEED